MSLWEELKSFEEEMKEDIEKVIEKLGKIDLYGDKIEIDLYSLYSESEDIRSIVSAAIKDLQKISEDIEGW